MQSRPHLTKMKDVIYFLMCEQGNYVKIGHSTGRALYMRINGLQVGCPFNLKIIRLIPGLPWQEEWLHKQFDSLRFRGEWFNYCDNMLTIEPPKTEYMNGARIKTIDEIISDFYNDEEPYCAPYAPFENQTKAKSLGEK